MEKQNRLLQHEPLTKLWRDELIKKTRWLESQAHRIHWDDIVLYVEKREISFISSLKIPTKRVQVPVNLIVAVKHKWELYTKEISIPIYERKDLRKEALDFYSEISWYVSTTTTTNVSL